MSDSDTLLVCSAEKTPEKYADWLVALSRNGSEWRETHRVQTAGIGAISCALSDSRALIGYGGDVDNSPYMELFRVESGPRIARLHRIHVTEQYYSFYATCTNDTLVAMSYPNSDNSVRLHRLRGDRLEELARIQLKSPCYLLWLTDRLLVAERGIETHTDAVIELEVSDTRLERRSELIATSKNIMGSRLCAVNDELAIYDDESKDILLYSLLSNQS